MILTNLLTLASDMPLYCFCNQSPTVTYVHGRRSRGTGDRSPPRIWSRGMLMQIVPIRFCHISTKKSVLCPSKYAKIRFWLGLSPRPHWGSPLGSSRRSPRPPSRLEGGHPSPYHTSLGTDPPSALTMRPPQNSSQIYACLYLRLIQRPRRKTSNRAFSVGTTCAWNGLLTELKT